MSKPDFLAMSDGSGRALRQEQVEYLQHLANSWGKYRVFGLLAPPGIGKSFIARTVQRAVSNTEIVTINNALVDQYTTSYPELNGVKGRDYYPSMEHYSQSRKDAAIMPNVFNPLSFYYYYLRRPSIEKPTTVVIDEAHKIDEMLLLTVSQSLACEKYSIPPGLTDEGFLAWAQGICLKLSNVHEVPDSTPARRRLIQVYETLKILADYLTGRLHTVKIFYEMKEEPSFNPKKRKPKPQLYLTIQPLVPPVGLLDTIFGPTTRLILMSGTLTKHHLERFFPNENSIDLVQFDPVAPRENRLIYFRPVQGDSRWDAGPIADAIRKSYLDAGRPNTLVHVSYGFSKILAPLLADLKPLFNVKEDKAEVLERFKARGGILLGAGMAEGIDLPGDLCRLVIVPRLLYANRGDQAVQKQLAFPDGQFWYGLSTLLMTVQQIGRGVRGAEDACNTIIMDPTWPGMINEHGKALTKGFTDSIVWNQNSSLKPI